MGLSGPFSSVPVLQILLPYKRIYERCRPLRIRARCSPNLFERAATPADLENAKAQFLGKAGRITELMKGLAALAPDEKKARGALINAAKQQIEAALNARRQALADAELEEQLKAEALDVSLPGRQRAQGGLHPVSLTLERIEAIFGSMGFDVAEGPEIETDWLQLHRAQHAGRPSGPLDARHVLCRRRHCSRAQFAAHPHQPDADPLRGPACEKASRTHRCRWPMPEIRVIAPGRTYRVDSDATHSPMFHQCEGLWMGENVSFKDLKVVFTDFCRTFFESDDLVLRFRPSFFPFTEPSAEIDIQFQSGPLAGPLARSGRARARCTRTWFATWGWTPESYIGFAFGMGPDRLTMLRYGVNDLRLFFDGDLRFLSQFQLIQS